MKKILSVTLAALMLFACLSLFSASAIILDENINTGLRGELLKAGDEDLIPIYISPQLECEHIPSFSSFAEDNLYTDELYSELSEERLAELRRLYGETYKEIAADISTKMQAIITDVFGEATPDELVIDPYGYIITLSAAKNEILELAEHENVWNIGLLISEMSQEEKEFLEFYYEAKGISEEKRSEYDDMRIYGKVGDLLLFYFEKGDAMYPSIMELQTLGQVLFVRGHSMPLNNPCGISVYDEENGFRALTEVYEAGEIDIMKVWEIVPFAYLVGDVNLDDAVNVKDATAMQKQIAEGKTKPWDCNPYFDIFDMNEDGEFNIKDATAVQRMLAG